MTKEKFLECSHPVLATIGRLFTVEQLSGATMSLQQFPQPAHAQPFAARMPDVGYMRQQAWSTWFIEMVYSEAYRLHPRLFPKITQVFTGSALDTFRRMCINHAFCLSETPTEGAIAFWQIGHTWLGQAGIVCKALPGQRFLCIEAHNPTGEEDGFFIKVKSRKLTAPHQPHGPNLQGFITPHPQYL
jgi:hypothetical protein